MACAECPRSDELFPAGAGTDHHAAAFWCSSFARGIYSSIKEIAAKEKIDPSYVGDVLLLTLLAPNIIEMIPRRAATASTSIPEVPKVTSTRMAGTTRRHTRELAR
jgi:hypothetical protein